MSIRSRLFLLLVPIMVVLAVLASAFFYINWHCALLSDSIYNALIIIILCAALAIVGVIVGIFFVANKISRPVKHLKKSALAIAAGHYGQKIILKGPQELVDLANTLNTMSECLQETMVRLKENALLRERMHGEYECAQLLQKQMLENVIKNFEHPHIEIKSIDIQSSNLFGLLFDITVLPSGEIEIVLAEAVRKGFSAIYQLLSQKSHFKNFHEPSSFPTLYLHLSHDLSYLHGILQGMPRPLIWSAKKEKLFYMKEQYQISAGDFILLYNHGLAEILETEETLYNWISRLFKHFAKDGLSTCSSMLEKELQFILRKKHIDRNAHLICIHII